MGKQQIREINASTPLWVVTYPIFVESILQMLVGNVDQLMISHYSDNAVAAIGNVNQLVNLVFIMFSVVSTASIILVSRALGAKDYGKVSEIYSLSVFVNLTFGTVMSVIMSACARPILQLLQTPPEVMEDAVVYLSIVGCGLFGQAVVTTLSAIFRANGHAKYTMLVAVAVNIISIIGNALTLYGWWGAPRLGVMGVAISALVSRLIGLVLLLILFKRVIVGSISLKYLRPFPLALLKRLLRVGLPTGGESLVYSLAQTVLLGFANVMGAQVLSARAYANILSWFAFVYAISVAQGSQIIVGHLIGAGDEDGVDRRVRKTLWPATLVSLCMTIVLYLSADVLMSAFTDNPEIIAIGKQVMLVEIALEIGRTFNVVIIRALQAAGDVRFPVLLGIGSMWGVMVPVGYLCGVQLGLGLAGLWIGIACDECLRALIVYIRWKKGSWRGRAFADAKAAT